MDKLVLFYGGRVHSQPDWCEPPHRHANVHQMIYVVSGRLEAQLRGQVLVGGTGDVLFYPRGVVHAERAVGHPILETYYIGFTAEGTEAWPLIRHDRNGRIGVMAQWIVDAITEARARDKIMLHAMLQLMLHEYVNLSIDADPEMIGVVKRYIQDHLAEPLQLEDLATVSGLSRFYFTRLFHRSTGVSPMRYLREARVQWARTLLLTTDLPLRTIAIRSGLSDEYQFSRIFKRVTGVPPSALR